MKKILTICSVTLVMNLSSQSDFIYSDGLINNTSSIYRVYEELPKNIDLKIFKKWFFTKNPSDFNQQFEFFFRSMETTPLENKNIYIEKHNDSNWKYLLNKYYSQKLLTYPNRTKNEELYNEEKKLVETYLLYDYIITPNEYSIIAHYGLYDKYKDTLKRHLDLLERSYLLREQNKDHVYVEPLHMILAQHGDSLSESLVLQRIEQKLNTYNHNNYLVLCYSIGTKKSYQRLKLLIQQEIKYLDKIMQENKYEPSSEKSSNQVFGDVVIRMYGSGTCIEELFKYKLTEKEVDEAYQKYYLYYKSKYPKLKSGIDSRIFENIAKLEVMNNNLDSLKK